MATFDYNAVQQNNIPRPQQGHPPCYTDEIYYDPTSRDCRSCTWQNSCKESIDAKRRNNGLTQIGGQHRPAITSIPQQVASPFIHNQPVPNAPHWPGNLVPNAPPPGVFRWPNIAQPAQPMAAYPNQYQQQPAQRPQVQNAAPTQYAFQDEHFGRVQDPLYYTISATPVPMRPQFAGETFTERLTKNVALHLMEVFLTQLLLGVRQMFMPPSKQG